MSETLEQHKLTIIKIIIECDSWRELAGILEDESVRIKRLIY
jgi:hypothetical protein